MSQNALGRIAILYPGDPETRRNATPDNNRFTDLFRAFAARGVLVEPAVYHDELADEVRQQLFLVDGVLVWVNPIHDGRDRSVLDAMLREVADAGVFVSAHPEIILKLGTKEVLYQTREMGWGSDTHLYLTIEDMRQGLSQQLASGKARVLKQYRGNGGDGVWKVQADTTHAAQSPGAGSSLRPDDLVHVRHAKRGSQEETITIDEFFGRCEPYFSGAGRMIDQQYQERLPEGMIRCYLVQDKVAGFGHQAINALYPATPGKPVTEAPEPGPRYYHPPTNPEFQALKQKLEGEWVMEMQELLLIDTASLPILWDCDFLLGPKDNDGKDTYILCEINASSVAPYPESAVPFIVETTVARIQNVR
jgi:hypothetical protein